VEQATLSRPNKRAEFWPLCSAVIVLLYAVLLGWIVHVRSKPPSPPAMVLHQA